MHSQSSPRHRDRTVIMPEEVRDLLTGLEQHRRKADQALRVFNDWLGHSPDLALAWNEFTALGGLSGAEFMRFLDGRFSPRRTVRKRHLRLITGHRQAVTPQ